MRLLILLFPVCLVLGIHSTPKDQNDPVSIPERKTNSSNMVETPPKARGTTTETQRPGSDALAQATTVPRQLLNNKEPTVVKENVVTAAGQAATPPSKPVVNSVPENPKELSDFLKSVAPWLQGNNPANISMSFIDVATNKIS
jgi:hypothetical protein